MWGLRLGCNHESDHRRLQQHEAGQDQQCRASRRRRAGQRSARHVGHSSSTISLRGAVAGEDAGVTAREQGWWRLRVVLVVLPAAVALLAATSLAPSGGLGRRTTRAPGPARPPACPRPSRTASPTSTASPSRSAAEGSSRAATSAPTPSCRTDVDSSCSATRCARRPSTASASCATRCWCSAMTAPRSCCRPTTVRSCPTARTASATGRCRSPASSARATTSSGSRCSGVRSTADPMSDAFAFEKLGPASAIFLVPRGRTPQLIEVRDLGPDSADPARPMWGAAAEVVGDTVYLYGTARPDEDGVFGFSLRVARVRVDDLLDQSRWRYWDGERWRCARRGRHRPDPRGGRRLADLERVSPGRQVVRTEQARRVPRQRPDGVDGTGTDRDVHPERRACPDPVERGHRHPSVHAAGAPRPARATRQRGGLLQPQQHRRRQGRGRPQLSTGRGSSGCPCPSEGRRRPRNASSRRDVLPTCRIRLVESVSACRSTRSSIPPPTSSRRSSRPPPTPEVDNAIARADAAYDSWRTTSYDQRAQVLGKVADAFSERADELAAIITTEMGKRTLEAKGEIQLVASIFRYYADNGARLLADEPLDPAMGGEAVVRKLPIGPLLGIMPWNFPYYQVARFAAPNLMAGNTILLKARPAVPALGSRARGDLPRRRPARGAATSTCSPPTTRPPPSSRTPGSRGSLVTGSERGRCRGGRERRAQPEEGRARAGWLRPVRRPRRRRPRAHGQVRRRRTEWATRVRRAMEPSG